MIFNVIKRPPQISVLYYLFAFISNYPSHHRPARVGSKKNIWSGIHSLFYSHSHIYSHAILFQCLTRPDSLVKCHAFLGRLRLLHPYTSVTYDFPTLEIFREFYVPSIIIKKNHPVDSIRDRFKAKGFISLLIMRTL